MKNTQENTFNVDALFKKGSIKNTIRRKAAEIGLSELKNHFGVSMIFHDYNDCVIVSEILKKFDKRYRHHISNNYEKDVYNTECILSARRDTFIYVNAYEQEHIVHMYLYIFGKKCIALRNYISKNFKSKLESDKTLYKVTGATDNPDKPSIRVFASNFKGRDFSTLYFNDGIEEEIKDFLDSWLKSEDIYKSRGLTYHTGILLGGKPGTGKSSIASAIATYLNCDLISIDTVSFGGLALANLVDSINHNDKKYVVLLDEIDSIFKSRDSDETTESQRAKTTKLLKFLDSAESPNNVIFVATTNYVENILNPEINSDAAAIRNGRFDKIMFIDNFTRNTAKRMCKGFNLSDEDIELVLGDGTEFNPAELQSQILDTIAHKETVESYIKKQGLII